jgi:AAA+ superfamily predicted ATPase
MNMMRNIKIMNTEEIATKRDVNELREETMQVDNALLDLCESIKEQTAIALNKITDKLNQNEQGPIIDEEFEEEKRIAQQATDKQKKLVYKLIKTMQEHHMIYDNKYTNTYVYNKMTKEEAHEFIDMYKPRCVCYF